MSTHKVEIDLTEGARALISVDGHDIAEHVTGLTLTARARRPPQLTLELDLTHRASIGAGAMVEVSQAVGELLVSLGWTPPSDLPEVT
jgi:hypothetical protein